MKTKPAYLKLYEHLREEIAGGTWVYGERLPSRRQIARDQGLSVVTVEHAYELLCQEGYAEAKAKSGYYVAYQAEEGFSAAPSAAVFRPPHPAAPAENTFPFSVLARTMRRVLTEYGEAILQKAPNAGCDELRAALSRYLARNRGIRAEAGQIVIGSGAEYLYGLVVEMLGAERVYGIERPSYHKIEQVYRAKRDQIHRHARHIRREHGGIAVFPDRRLVDAIIYERRQRTPREAGQRTPDILHSISPLPVAIP